MQRDRVEPFEIFKAKLPYLFCSLSAPPTFEFYKRGDAQGKSFCSFWNASGPDHNSQYLKVLQAERNKRMHISQGNTMLSLAVEGNQLRGRVLLALSDLIPHPNPPIQHDHEGESRVYSIDELLKHRTSQRDEVYVPPTLTTPLVNGSAMLPSKGRTGRRIKIHLPNGNVFYKKRPKKKRRSFTEFTSNSKSSQTPPPRGAPGIPIRDNGERPQGDGTQARSRGAKKRSERRRAYRLWRRQGKQGQAKGVGFPSFVPPPPKKATQSRAKWFRNSILWQGQLKRQRKRKVTDFPTTPPLSYDSRIKIGTINVQGFADTLKLKNSIQMMREHKIDVLILSETKSSQYYSYTSEQYLVILSGNSRDKYAGVGAIVSPRLRPHLLDVLQYSTRLIHLAFKKQGGNFHVVGVYAPHSELDLEEEREPFWEDLDAHLNTIPGPEPIYVTGDFNVRFQASHRNDAGVTGPFTYGKGSRYIDHNAFSNRSLCVRTMQVQDMVEVASYKTPNMMQQITYRDKTAPPKDWSQFVLDPIGIQQFYDLLHNNLQEYALVTAAHVRSFLDLHDILPPPKLLPQVDPIRFQRLDHCFTRRQWINTVRNCRSKLYTGFPSDHYLLVTEIQIKLASRPPKPPQPPRYEYGRVTEAQRAEYNSIFRDLLEEGPVAPVLPILEDHNAEKVHYYTDGSGTRGRCSAKTAAGWGWCFMEQGQWVEACGPVITCSDHNAYRGAAVGSNNTGEISAIIEALLHAHQRASKQVVIHSDSLWAINTITGRWRAKTHKAMVNFARLLVRQGDIKVHFQWVKGHSGVEGNERADGLAERGKILPDREGTTANQPEIATENQPHATSSKSFTDAMQEAAKQTFSTKSLNPRRPWITQETLQLLAEARALEANQDADAKKKRNQAKRQARKDRIEWVHRQVASDPQGQGYWKAAKSQKRGFQGKRRHLVVEGKPIPWSRSHDAFKQHLEHKQWCNRHLDHTALRAKRKLYQQFQDQEPFTLEELQSSLAKLKNNKAPGPDQTPNELFKLLDAESEIKLLALYNEIWEKGEAPEEWKQAVIVTLYKGKGADTDPANYRPISLLSGVYKVFAAMLQTRLSWQHEENIRDTQYGFRTRRGTVHPLFVLRRAMEWSEMTNNPLNLLFLDWKQAFDSLDHNAMLIALERFGLSNRALIIIHSLYSERVFITKGINDQTALGTVGSGIRQGCPLSPYLFIMVLTVIFEDVDADLMAKGVATNSWSVGHPVYDLEYADDTLLISLTTPQMQSMLSDLECQAALHGMKLNYAKTEVLYHPKQAPPDLRFSNGEKVQTTTQTKYLGSMISWTKPFEVAYQHRAGIAETAYKKLRLIWNSSLSKKKKLHIFQSTFLPTLTYGLDAITLTDKYLARVDAYYIRFLRA